MKLKKLWKRKSVSITECDPTYKVIYLGNVLTGWAKGEGCAEKPLATLWRNYCQSTRPDIYMKVTICNSGLRATTEEHGLTEYWAHRITHCSAHPAYPKVFCWIYRHEGRRLKQELRCHAVLCPKQPKAQLIVTQLTERLASALHEFRREKTIRQNARLSVVHSIYEAVLPLRKVNLMSGTANYRPPLERSKSAPKLGSIEEVLDEEEQYEEEEKIRERLEELNLELRMLRIEPKDIEKVNKSASSQDSIRVPVQSPLKNEEEDDILPCPLTVDFRPSKGDDSIPVDFRSLHNTSIPVDFRSSPDLFFLPPPPPPVEESSVDSDADEDSLPPILPSSLPPDEENSSNSHHHLALLESFKDKLVVVAGEESLTSDQPESIGSCSSSSTDEDILVLEVGSDVIIERDDLLKSDKVVSFEEEDNISEESGYSEGKDCGGPQLVESAKIKAV